MNQIIFQVWGSTLYESVNSYGCMELGKASGLGLELETWPDLDQETWPH